MSKQVQNFIDDARRFQRCSDHDLAISSLQLAQQEDHHKEHEIEIQKLFSLSYRKIGNYNMALLHINNAINQNAKRNNDKQAQNEHAICLMNKGIIYEESKRYDNALDCYISAVDTFISLHKNNPEEHGLIINALLTLGLFYYKRGNFESAKDTLESALTYFGEGRKNDRRYLAIGMHCIAFEHGTTNSYSTGANSVDHVHLHILPFSRPVWNEIITNIPATTVNTVESYNDLFEVWKKNIPDTYLLFQDLDQKLYYISDSSYMPSQLFRKCLAPYLGANYWDWRSESYSNNILETISLFKGIIE